MTSISNFHEEKKIMMKGLEEMKKTLKRLAASALAAVMTLGLSATAFADGNGGDRTLTVTGDTLDNKKVYAVQMFDARVTGEGSYTFDNYELVDAWLSFFTTATGSGGLGLTDQDSDSDTDADDARAYVEGLSGQGLADFAHLAQKWVRAHSTDFTVISSDTEAEAVADTETFTQLKPGYYLVYPEGGSTGNDNRATDAMLVNVPRDDNATWNIKSTYPTVDKKVDTGSGAADNGSAQVGDTVTFTLTSKVPDMSDYTTYYFAFNDTLTNGLGFVQKTPDPATIEANDVTVTIGGEPVAAGYTVSLQDNVLKVVFDNLKNVAEAADAEDVGKAIVVTYQAMITEAATTENPATNTVEVEYSNDPTSTGHGTSTPDLTKVYTYEIDVNKWAADAGGIDGNLAGAKFVLSTSATLTNGENDASVIKLVNTDSGTGNAYRVAKSGEAGAVTSFTTTATGDITISGLEGSTTPGTTYYLHEIEAPAGYNQLKAPVAIVITVTDYSTGAATITVDGDPAGGDGTVVNVENKKGIELPETGSIGTIGLTVAGVAIVLLGVFATRKKKVQE